MSKDKKNNNNVCYTYVETNIHEFFLFVIINVMTHYRLLPFEWKMVMFVGLQYIIENVLISNLLLIGAGCNFEHLFSAFMKVYFKVGKHIIIRSSIFSNK